MAEEVVAATSVGGEVPAAPPEPAAPPTDPFDNAETQQFDRKYVTGLREEAAKHRTAAKEAAAARDRYAAAFGGWGDEDADVLLEAVAQAAADPAAGAATLRQIADLLAGDIKQTVEKPAEAPKIEALTQADLDKILNDRDEAKALQAEITSVEQEAAKLGYEKGTEGYFRLLWLTAHKTNFDMGEADKQIKAERDAVIAEYLASKAPTGAGAAPSQGSAPSGGQPITNLRQASDSARERLRAALQRS